MTRWALLLVVVPMLAACGGDDPAAADGDADADADADADTDADADADADADGDTDADADGDADPFGDCGAREPAAEPEPGPSGCSVPDRSCPVEHPHPGGPCEGTLDCEYSQAGTEEMWHYECLQGAWTAWSDYGSAPPLSELCLNPFQGSLEGGEIEIGPADPSAPFRPFHDCETIDPIWGGQGAAMLAFRVRVRGVESPECLLLHTTLRANDVEPPESGARVSMHCNESLAVYSILDAFPLCGQELLGVEVHATVDGVGETSARVLLRTQPECCLDCDG